MNQFTALSQAASFTENLSLEGVKSQLQAARSKLASLRPPQEFFNLRAVSKPANMSEIQQRVSYNLGYYSSNYALVVAMLSLYTLFTNLLLLSVIVFVFVGVWGIGKLQGQELTTPFGVFQPTQLYTALLCVAVPLGFFASPISAMLWLVGASSVTIFAHASLMEKPIETVFEEQV
ncbi:Yip3p KNAG_0H02140 [Huiozyma naganishii CBS 8797]|uniref:PRA1 family protein n=1 Tax=Huiozyma naganishii (strain ATCC MYA-139 / BCRC 22969 / CBS 8797 / KCTC 17520 / NBRC 10181 / NCYC 3082 / Yp74L-3) TaxID=1071383 RepID=J7RPI9_HUIN7|nr:hypothetical protein KNAG_0H02140 [Kazachstania naganishii CBS 8797]CCK71628.1 hypothetical protein KNAG_0H02140 [Kazachstania naganishii CBS 8797]